MDMQAAGSSGQQAGAPFQANAAGFFGNQAPQQLSASEALLARLFEQQQIFTNQLMAQQQEFMHQQQEMFRNAMASINVQVPPNPEIILDSLANNIKEFRFDLEGNITFAGWYARYDDLFLKDAMRLDDEAKVRLLMRKLGTAEHERYASFILPKQPKDFQFQTTVEKLKMLFGTTESDVSKRYRCLQMSKQATEDYVTFACRINKACVEFELRKLSEEQFKCLSFVCGLKAEEDAEVRTRLLSKIEDKKDVTLEQLSEDCQRLLNLKRDTAMIESSSAVAVQQVKRKFVYPDQQSKTEDTERGSSRLTNRPPSPCWYCGAMHFVRDCNYVNHTCSDCGQTGHREGYCSSAGTHKKSSERRDGSGRFVTNAVSVQSISAKRRPVVQAKLDGVNIQFRLDTGSDVSVVGRRTWERIGKPPTQPANAEIFTASGDLLELLFKFTCTVEINNEFRRAQFFVVEDSLQLVGLDILESFGLQSAPISAFCSFVADTAGCQDEEDSSRDGWQPASVSGRPDDTKTSHCQKQQNRGGEKVNKYCLLLSANQRSPSHSKIWLPAISTMMPVSTLTEPVRPEPGIAAVSGVQAIVRNQSRVSTRERNRFMLSVSTESGAPSTAVLPYRKCLSFAI